MSNEELKKLAEEARALQESTVEKEKVEKEVIDIDYVEVKDEPKKITVYNKVGLPFEIEEEVYNNTKSAYYICEDGSIVFGGNYWVIGGKRYNFWIYRSQEAVDKYGLRYIKNRPETQIEVITFDASGEFDFTAPKRIVSIDASPKSSSSPTVKIFINGDNYLFDRRGIQESNYDLKDEKYLVKKKTIEDVKEIFFKQYPYFQDTISSIYGDNWDIEYNKSIKKFAIIIKFDKIIIKNSRKLQHEITDLYFLVPIFEENDTWKIYAGLYGGRATITTEEQYHCYLHSHLSASWNAIGGFCLGDGPINGYILDFNKTPNENTLFSILYNVKIYLEWESLEGGPYNKIQNLGKSEISTSDSVSFDFVKVYKNYLKNFQFPVTLVMKNGLLEFQIDTKVVEEQLVNCINPEHKFFKNKTTGVYYKVGNTDIAPEVSKIPLLKFKGEEIFSKTYHKNVNIEDKDYVAHPYITRRITEYALPRIRSYYFKKISGIDTGKRKDYHF